MIDIIKSVMVSWQENEDMSMNQAFDFEGSDEDIRDRFEVYLSQMLISQTVEEIPLSEGVNLESTANTPSREWKHVEKDAQPYIQND